MRDALEFFLAAFLLLSGFSLAGWLIKKAAARLGIKIGADE